MAFRYARGATHGTDCLLAHAGDSVGVVLSPVLLFNLGICFLLFRNELFYRRLWRSSSPEGVAPRGSDRTHYRWADMCGLSVSFLFAVVHRLVERDEQVELIEGRSKDQGP